MNLTNVIKQCIRMNLQNQAEHPDLIYAMSKEKFSKDFKTVSLNLGRRSGKTSTIISMYAPDDLVIVHDTDAKRFFYPNNVHVMSIQEITRINKGHGSMHRGGMRVDMKFNRVFIDEPGFITAEDIFGIYTVTTANVYVFLGG